MSLKSVQDIERAIDAWTPQQIEELYRWLDQCHPQPIDVQIEADLAAGRIDDRIDDRIDQAMADRKAGKNTTSLTARRHSCSVDKQFALLKDNPQHPSLQFKKIGDGNGQEIWSARVTLKYRALAVKLADEYIWFWIGEHNVYDALIR